MKAVGASGEGIEKGIAGWVREMDPNAEGREMALQKMTKRHILVKSCWAIRQFVLSTTLTPTPPCFGSGLFVLPCKCISLKHVISTFVAPTRSRRISNFSPAFYNIRNEALLPSWQFSLLCLLFSLLLVFVHRNNLSFLFYFIANFAWQRGRCWLCRECYVKGNFCNEFN